MWDPAWDKHLPIVHAEWSLVIWYFATYSQRLKTALRLLYKRICFCSAPTLLSICISNAMHAICFEKIYFKKYEISLQFFSQIRKSINFGEVRMLVSLVHMHIHFSLDANAELYFLVWNGISSAFWRGRKAINSQPCIF